MTDYLAARTNMVDGQIRPSDVTLYPILDAMLNVPREVYVPADKRAVAYVGEHLELADSRTVLAPRTLAKMLETLDIQPDELVLDLGAGLGYSTAVLSRLAEAVVAVEENADFARQAEVTLSEQSADNVLVFEGPLAQGASAHGPYDVIVVEGGVEVIPELIVKQLKKGGRIAAIFMEGEQGQARMGIKTAVGIDWEPAFDATAPVLPGFARARTFVF